MSKKDKARQAILDMHDGHVFTQQWLADKCEITAKDVSNVTRELLKVGVLVKHHSATAGKFSCFKVNANNAALWFAKHPIGVSPTPQFDDRLHKTVKRCKNRTPFQIAIDSQIADLECKIKRLNAVRKEFS